MAYARRSCEICSNLFTPPHRSALGAAATWKTRCAQCRRAADAPLTGGDVEAHSASAGDPEALVPPMVQGVFDLETFGLDRGWGVLMVFSMLVHGGGKPRWVNFDLTMSPGWPEVRSDDRWLAEQALAAIAQCNIVYAHNGSRFDLPWLRTLALKYDLPWNEKKLVDPCSVAWKKYRIGSNSLSSLAQFLRLDESKMLVGPEVWRTALFDNDQESWATLRERCQSDVRLLNAVAARVSKDVGMIDNHGSAWR